MKPNKKNTFAPDEVGQLNPDKKTEKRDAEKESERKNTERVALDRSVDDRVTPPLKKP